MDYYISYSPWRREEWKGHRDEKGVRSAIRYAQRYGTELRVFVDGGTPALGSYVEIPPSDWNEVFFAE